MPGFKLEEVGGALSVDLPLGAIPIGRGPFLGVSDKRVSRTHGLLENMDGQLRLKPIHVNPCFIQASLEAAPEPLPKDEWHCLTEGSIFSLLPGKYIFRVRVITEETTPSNSQAFEEEELKTEEEEPKHGRQYEETLEYTPQVQSVSLSPQPTETKTHKPEPAPGSQAESAPQTPQRRRILPAWMTDACPADQSLSKAKAAAKRTPAKATPKQTPSKQTKRARAKQPSSAEEEEEESEPEHIPRKKRAKKLPSDTEESQQEQVSEPEPSRERSPEDRHRIPAHSPNTEQRRGRERAEESAGSHTHQRSEVSSEHTAQRRTPCAYGSSCYRKNPVHFQECSHPGDDDYEEEQSNSNDDDDEDDDRPECPYGTDCYRKNPQHKKEFKHTKPPASVQDDEAADEDEDEDHYENSFIDDDEVEDSDYVPESEESGGEEDIKRLQKEAKAFMKRRK